MVSAHTHAAHASLKERVNTFLDPAKSVLDRKWIHGEVTEIGNAIFGEGIHIQRGIPGPNDGRLCANVAWPKPRAGTIGGAAVEGHAYERNLQFFRLRNVGKPHECRNAREACVFESVDRLRMRQMKLPAGLRHGAAS